MARKKRRGSSVSAYFREQFAAHPEWLTLSKNTELVEQWMQDHDGKEMPKKVRQSMANIKSMLRHKPGGPGGTGKGKRRAKTTVAPRNAVAEVEHLEGMIDNCLAAARSMDVKNLEPVIKHLHRARNNIVLAFDKPD